MVNQAKNHHTQAVSSAGLFPNYTALQPIVTAVRTSYLTHLIFFVLNRKEDEKSGKLRYKK
jgi:hypothetical protein